jgi:hypothetical protein
VPIAVRVCQSACLVELGDPLEICPVPQLFR